MHSSIQDYVYVATPGLKGNGGEEKHGDKVLDVATEGVTVPTAEVDDLVRPCYVHHQLRRWQICAVSWFH